MKQKIANAKFVKKLPGLSKATVNLIQIDTGEFLVTKSIESKLLESANEGLLTLKRELNFYNSIAQPAKDIFPDILYYENSSSHVMFVMPYYFNGFTLENLFERKTVTIFVQHLIKELCTRLYTNTLVKIKSFSPVRNNYILEISNRSNVLPQYSHLFSSVMTTVESLEKLNIFSDLDESTSLVNTHGDLTMKNILVDPLVPNSFKLIDPHPLGKLVGLPSDPAEDFARLLAYIYPIYPVKYSALTWRKENGGYMYISVKHQIVRRCINQAKALFFCDQIYESFRYLYKDKKLFLFRVILLWALNVLRVSLDRLEDGNEKIGIGYYVWALGVLESISKGSLLFEDIINLSLDNKTN